MTITHAAECVNLHRSNPLHGRCQYTEAGITFIKLTEDFVGLIQPNLINELPANMAKQNIYGMLNEELKEVRLLIVNPGSDDAVVRCSFLHANLAGENVPPYETISYVWGDPKIKAEILLNDHPFQVPTSAERVLRRMRYADRERVLWIDAVCMNQEDLYERASQVGLMGNLYSNCSRNIIWLGEDDGSTSKALEAMQSVLEEIRVETDDWKQYYEILFGGAMHNWTHSSSAVKAQFDEDALINFYNSRWFSRAWVVQEASLPLRNICYRGDFELSFMDALRVARWLHFKRHYLSTRLVDCVRPIALKGDTADHEYGKLNVVLSRGNKWGLWGLLMSYGMLAATEPRDHIFAFLGLWQKYAMTNEIPALLSPDYVKPVRDVFRDAARFVIEQEFAGSLEPLIHVYHGSRQNDPLADELWPSWVPRFYLQFDPRLDMTNWPERTYQAHNDMLWKPVSEQSTDPAVLTAKGLVVDTVVQTTPTFSLEALHIMRGLEIMLQDVASISPVEKIQSPNRIPNTAMGLVAGYKSPGIAAVEQECVERFVAFKQLVQEENRLPFVGPDIPPSATDSERAASVFWQALRWACPNRKVFSTASGYIGLGPSGLESGDMLVVLYGLAFPAILRPLQNGEHRFIGVTYVNGIMHGEAVRKHIEEGVEDLVFNLR